MHQPAAHARTGVCRLAPHPSALPARTPPAPCTPAVTALLEPSRAVLFPDPRACSQTIEPFL
eukprot:scaffold2899_cov106-Isochrysis_galbana.AAC.6